jgi:hypothetical protein
LPILPTKNQDERREMNEKREAKREEKREKRGEKVAMGNRAINRAASFKMNDFCVQ